MTELLTQVQILDEAEVARVHAAVHELRDHWTRRDATHPFFTLGAASYLDARHGAFAAYQALAGKTNPLLAERFGWVHERLLRAVSRVVDADARYDERLALPGFHIHLREPGAVVPAASLHFDLQYELIDWQPFGVPDRAAQMSLTAAIALPAEGGGLLVWNINRLEIERMSDDDRRAHMAANREATRHAYRPGYLALHSGHQLHQMAPPHDPQPGDERITIQAHALPIDGRWIVYW